MVNSQSDVLFSLQSNERFLNFISVRDFPCLVGAGASAFTSITLDLISDVMGVLVGGVISFSYEPASHETQSRQ